MAKWTKSNNPHTRIIRVPQSRPAPIIRVSAPRAAPKKHHRRRHHRGLIGGGGSLTQNVMISFALGGAALGLLEKNFGASLPAIPLIGRKGTLALLAGYFSKGRGGLIRDIAVAGAVLSGYELGTTGKISGIDGDIVPQISGIAAQV